MAFLIVKTAILAVAIMGCDSMDNSGAVVKFCPWSEETRARALLDLGNDSEIYINELLNRASSLGHRYEVALGDNAPRRCENAEAVPNAITYTIYTGFDETNTFTLSYLIVAEASGLVRYIESRHAYPAPRF